MQGGLPLRLGSWWLMRRWWSRGPTAGNDHVMGLVAAPTGGQLERDLFTFGQAGAAITDPADPRLVDEDVVAVRSRQEPVPAACIEELDRAGQAASHGSTVALGGCRAVVLARLGAWWAIVLARFEDIRLSLLAVEAAAVVLARFGGHLVLAGRRGRWAVVPAR